MSKILIVEDEESIADLEKDYLELSGFEVVISNRGDLGLEKALNEDFDLIILDLMLPGVDGFEICRQIRGQKNTPIIMVSAKKDDIDKIRGLGLGADDYMTKPFLMQELLLRISGILRRAYRGQLRRETALRLGERTVDLSDATVSSAGGTVTLTATERAILQKLLDNRGHIVTYDALCEAVWGSDYYGCENSLNVHIRHLREKVEEQPSQPVWILTARGLGYKLAKEGTK